MAATKTLYRSLIRLGKLYDANPVLKVLVSPSAVAPSTPTTLPLAVESVYRSVIYGFLDGSERYVPKSSLTAYIRDLFRSDLTVSGEGDDADNDLEVPEDVLLDVAFAGLKHLNSLPVALNQATQAAVGRGLRDLSPFLQQLAGAGKVEVVQNFEEGCLLLDHPLEITPGRGAQLVFMVEDKVGTLVVNRPLPSRADRLGLTGPLADNLLFFGGTNLTRDSAEKPELRVLHPHADIDQAIALRHGLYLGGTMESIEDKIKSGAAQPSDFKLLLGHTMYDIEDGMPLIPQGTIAVDGPGVGPVSLFGTDTPEADMLAVQCAVWEHVMRSIGGEYAALAQLPLEVATELMAPQGSEDTSK